MALVTGTLAALGTASKILAGTSAKKALMGGAKNFLKDQAKDVIGDRIAGRGRKKKKGGPAGPGQKRPGALSKSGSAAIEPVDGIIRSKFSIIPNPENTKKVQPKSKGQVSFSTISTQLESIVSLTSMIEAVSAQGIKSKKKLAERTRKDNEKSKSKEREDRLEGVGKGALGFLGNKLKEGGQKSGIFNFLTQIFLGFITLKLLPLVPNILKGIEFVTKNLHLSFLAFKGINGTLKIVGKEIGKFIDEGLSFFGKIGDSIKTALGGLKNGVVKIFKKLGNIIPNFVKKGFAAARAAVKAAKDLSNKLVKRLTGDTRTSTLGSSNKSLQQLLGSSGTGKGSGTLSRGLQSVRAKHGDEAARMYQGLIDNGVKPQRALRYLNNSIDSGKLTSAPMKGSLAGGVKGSKIFKGGANRSINRGLVKTFGKNNKLVKGIVNSGGLLATKSGMSRIPIIGPLIVAATTYFEDADGDGIPDKKLDKTLFKAGGALLGGFLGTFIPIPILGTILGELIGEYVGELFYVLLRGGGVNEVGNKLKKDIMSVLQTGQKVLGWAGDGFKRMYEGLPKITIPFVNYEIVNFPALMINPLQIAPVMMKAFFSRDPMAGGEVKKVDESNKESISPDSPPASAESSSTDKSGSPNMQADRPGSDTAGLKAVAPSSSKSVTPYDASGGDRNRKIFLHWTAGGHDTPYSYYHTTFLGSGKAVRYTPYGQDKNSHTAGANTGSIGLSIAAMHGPDNQDRASSWPTPPTSAQMDAMITEAAQIALDWGWDTSTVDKNVRTHGEWEREATSTGVLSGGPQRWDLDKLKPSDPNINVSKTLSHGGNTLRSKIKAKMASLKNGTGQKEEKGSPTPPPAVQVSPVESSKKIKKPVRSDYKGRSGAKQYEEAMKSYNESQGTPVKAEVTPTETMTGKDVKPVTTTKMEKPMKSDYTGRSGANQYEKDLKKFNSQQRSDTSQQTEETSTPVISPSSSPSSQVSSVEQETSYEAPQESSSVMVLPTGSQSGGGGASSGQSGQPVMMGSGNVLNSYYKSQLLGFLYKQG